MQTNAERNKKAWEFDAYQFWVKQSGTPEERAQKMLENPEKMLKRYASYFDSYSGQRIANICGSCGKKAVPLALLGAEVTIFDISEGNKRYACEMADAAQAHIDFIVGDVMQMDLDVYGGYFDVVFMEGGILHYFFDINEFFRLMYQILKPGGKMICSDFHPFQKVYDAHNFQQPVMDYFSDELVEGEMAHARFYPEEIRRQIPKCIYRKYNLSEIINGVLDSQFVLKRFDEHPVWDNKTLPGEFTIVAVKQSLN